MIVSRCCKEQVFVRDSPNGGYYVCTTCLRPAETFCLMVLSDLQDMEGSKDDEDSGMD